VHALDIIVKRGQLAFIAYKIQMMRLVGDIRCQRDSNAHRAQTSIPCRGITKVRFQTVQLGTISFKPAERGQILSKTGELCRADKRANAVSSAPRRRQFSAHDQPIAVPKVVV